METFEQSEGKSLEEILQQYDAVIASSWLKLASLVRAAEQVSWTEASARARELYNAGQAQEYIDAVRASVKTKTVTKSKEPEPTQPNNSRDQYSMNYRRLLKVVPDLVEQLQNADAELHGKSYATGYMDLHFDLVGKNKRGYYVALSHYYKQNGDMIADPDMVLRVDLKNQTVEALTYQDSFGYKEVYDNYMNPQTVRTREQKSQNSFLGNWLRNLIQQGHEIEFDEPEDDNTEKTKAHKEESKPDQSETTKQPDISFMEYQVIEEIRTAAQKSVLDDVLKIVTEKIEGKLKLRPVAEYFLIERINTSPLGINLPYPKEKDIKEDYELLVEQAKKLKQAEKDLTVEQSGKGSNQDQSKLNRSEFKDINQLYKFNYQLLLRLIPEISDTKIESLKGTLQQKKEGSEQFLFEGMQPVNSRVHALSFQGVERDSEGLQFIAINKQSKKIWLLGRVGNFDGKPDYQQDEAEAAEKFKANKHLGEWLNKMVSAKFKAVYPEPEKPEEWDDDVNTKIPDFEPGEVQLVEAHKKAGITQKHIDWINKHQMGMTLTPVKNMKNNTENFFADMAVQALKPGFRISRTGKLYRENRSNRSDMTKGGL